MFLQRDVKERFDSAKRQIEAERDENMTNSAVLSLLLDGDGVRADHGGGRGDLAYWCQFCETVALADERPENCPACGVEGSGLTEHEPVDVEGGEAA